MIETGMGFVGGLRLDTVMLDKITEIQVFFEPLYRQTGNYQLELAALHTFRGADLAIPASLRASNAEYYKAIDVLKNPVRMENDTSLADIHNLLHFNYLMIGDYFNSIQCLDFAEATYQRLGMMVRVGMADINRSIVFMQQQKGSHALAFAETAKKILQTLPPSNQIVIKYRLSALNALCLAHKTLADSLMQVGNFKMARRNYQWAADLHHSVTDTLMMLGAFEDVAFYVFKSWFHEAKCLSMLGENEQALSILQQLTQQYNDFSTFWSDEEWAMAYAMKGELYSRKRQYDLSHAAFERAQILSGIMQSCDGSPDLSTINGETKIQLTTILSFKANALKNEGISLNDTALLRRATVWKEAAAKVTEALSIAHDSGESDQ